MAIKSRKRVLVNINNMALVAGIWAFADFQVMPPFGRSMMSSSGGP